MYQYKGRLMKVSSKRGLEIIEQGKKQFMAGWEDYNCPFDERRQPVERKLWLKGFHEAKIKWYKPMEDRKRAATRRNGGVLWKKNKQSIQRSMSQPASVR